MKVSSVVKTPASKTEQIAGYKIQTLTYNALCSPGILQCSLYGCHRYIQSQANPNAYYAKHGDRSNIVVPFVHVDHFVFPCTISPSPPYPPPGLAPFLVARCLRSRGCLTTKVDGSQFPPLTCPYTQGSHDSRTAYLQRPPKQVGGYRMCVQGGDDEMNKVDSKGKVKDEFRAGDE